MKIIRNLSSLLYLINKKLIDSILSAYYSTQNLNFNNCFSIIHQIKLITILEILNCKIEYALKMALKQNDIKKYENIPICMYVVIIAKI